MEKAAGFSFSEPPEGCFDSTNVISPIWFGSGLIWCGIGAGVGALKVVYVEGLHEGE